MGNVDVKRHPPVGNAGWLGSVPLSILGEVPLAPPSLPRLRVIEQIDAQLNSLAEQAEIGNLGWLAVALQERAHLGIVMYATWWRLTPKERQDIGVMSQTSARARLGLR